MQKDDSTCLYVLQFADYQVICANEDDLEYMASRPKEENGKWRLKMNVEKKQQLCMGEDVTDIQVENNEVITRCENYKYLGISFNKEYDTEIKYRKNKA